MALDLSRYLDLYVAESREHLTAGREIASALGSGELAGEAALLELYRHAHSLKGMAAAMGYGKVAEVAHAAEDLLEAVRQGRQAPAAAAPALLAALGTIAAMVERAARGEAPDDPLADRCANDLRARAHPAASSPRGVRAWRMDFVLDAGVAGATGVGAILAELSRLGTIRTAAAPTGGAARLMVLIDSGATREMLASVLATLPGVASFLVRADVDAAPPRAAVPRSPALARVPAAALEALAAGARELLLEEMRAGVEEGASGSARRRAARRRRLLARLHAQATELRLEPFHSVAPRLAAAVRQAGAELGRKVRMEVVGGEMRLERSLLDALVEPLVHVVRNAVDHGIEPPEARVLAGKRAEGLVRLRLESTGDDASIVVEDDGRGLDPAALRAAAVRLGVLTEEEAARLRDDAALSLITRPGFTTAARPGPVSGRGIGMDVVRATVEGLGGRLLLGRRPEGGARITFLLPRSPAARPALLMRGADGTVAVPLEAVTRVAAADRGATVWLERGDGSTARLAVTEILGRREIVVQPLAPAARALGFTGAALLDDGAIALVLDPSCLPS